MLVIPNSQKLSLGTRSIGEWLFSWQGQKDLEPPRAPAFCEVLRSARRTRCQTFGFEGLDVVKLYEKQKADAMHQLFVLPLQNQAVF